jgi:uncharacterized membrane protein
MSIALGVYDFFTYTVPGSLYLALATYIASRLAWIDPLRIAQANTTLVILVAFILSYLLGHVTYEFGYLLSRVYGRDKSRNDAVLEFIERVPTAKGRPFLGADRSVLQAAVELHEIGAAMEIGRLRSVGLMLRNTAPVFALGAIVEIADALTGAHPVVAVCCIVIFLLVAVGCLSQSAILRHWANMKTLELAYWIPDIDHSIDPGNTAAEQSQPPRPSSSSQEVRRSTTSTPRSSKRQAKPSPNDP